MPVVLLCNTAGTVLGKADRAAAHSGKGQLHRAFSVFVFNEDRSKLLLQKRAAEKLFGGRFANTCCSHLREGETVRETAERRLREECGFSVPLKEIGSFVYRAEDPGKGVEYEYDTVLAGMCAESVALRPEPKEVAGMEWIEIEALKRNPQHEPERYAPWLQEGLCIILHSAFCILHSSQ